MIESLLSLRNFAQAISAVRKDGWENALTGVGTARDKTTYGSFCTPYRISDEELGSLFHHHDTSKRIISVRPKELFKNGFEVEIEEDTDSAKEINNAIKKAGILHLFRNSMIFSRLYGGGLIILGADDGKDLSEPLEDDAAIRTISFMLFLDKRYVYEVSKYEDPQKPKYLQTELYGLQSITGQSFETPVHETRVIRLGGAMTDIRERLVWGGWDYSVLQHIYDVLRDQEQNWKSTNHLLSDASQGVFKIKGLINSLMTVKGQETMNTRMQLLDMCRSVARAVLLDADHNEDFTRVQTPFTGIPDMLDKTMSRTASAAEYPVAFLFETNEGGLNNNGESNYRRWYDGLASEQQQDVEPVLRKVIDLMCRAEDGPTSGNLPEDYTICFKSLWQPTPKEKAEIDKLYAERDQIRILGQVWNASEVALAIAKNPDPDRPVQIDTELHQMMLDNEKELAKNGPPEIDTLTGKPLAGAPIAAAAKSNGNAGNKGTAKPVGGASNGNKKPPTK